MPPSSEQKAKAFKPRIIGNNQVGKKRRPHINYSVPNQTMVAILIGPEEALFNIHKANICGYSPYFKEAFTNKNYIESKTQVIKLPKVDVKVFGLFNNWLYHQVIQPSEGKSLDSLDLTKLWVLADHWKIPTLQNDLMNHLVPMLLKDQSPRLKDPLVRKFIEMVYFLGGPRPLKRLAVQSIIEFIPKLKSPKEWLRNCTPEMILDLSDALIKHLLSLPVDKQHPVLIEIDVLLPVKEGEVENA